MQKILRAFGGKVMVMTLDFISITQLSKQSFCVPNYSNRYAFCI